MKPGARPGAPAAAGRASERSFLRCLGAIACGAFALRAAYAFTIQPRLPAIGDDAFYYLASNLIAQGHGYAQPFSALFAGHLVPTAAHPPLWPALLAVLSLFTAPSIGVGTPTGTAFDLHLLVGCLVGAWVVVLVGLLGRRIAGRRVGLLAAALAALYPRFIVLDAALSAEPLYAAIVGSMLLVGYAFLRRPSRTNAAALGVLVALAALTHAEGLLYAPVLLAPLIWRAGPSRRPLAVWAAAGLLVILVPWTVRNQIAFGRFVPVANSGAVVAGANCHLTYYGSALGSWQPACTQIPNPSSNEAIQSERQQSQALSYARRHPARAVLIAGIRLMRVWSLYAPNGDAVGERTLLWIGIAMYYCLLAAAAWMLVALRRRGRSILLLAAPAIVVSLAALLGDGLERLRYPAELPMLVLAAFAAVRLAPQAVARLRPRAVRLARW